MISPGLCDNIHCEPCVRGRIEELEKALQVLVSAKERKAFAGKDENVYRVARPWLGAC